MSKYNSSLRRFVARQVALTALGVNPPDTITTWTTYNRLLTFQAGMINAQSLMVIRSLMVNCNFADGLVWQTNNCPIAVRLTATPYYRSATIGNLTCTKNASTIAVATAGLTSGDILVTQPAVPSPVTSIDYLGGQYIQVGTIIDGVSFSGSEMPWLTHAAVPAYKLIPITLATGQLAPNDLLTLRDQSSTILVGGFNETVEVNETLNSASYQLLGGTLPTITDTMLTVSVDVTGLILYTQSISSAFVGLFPRIDVMVDLEYTPVGSSYR